MKASGLVELIGQVIKIRPAVKRQDFDGKDLPSIEDSWRVARASSPKVVVEIHNLATGHFVELSSDNVYEFRTPNTLVLKEQITLTPNGLIRDPLPDPRARYTRPRLRSRS